ncbi:MAG: transposase [Proteobacteria bacterium]|nr:transposase [Pseudomonadota bacterium]
MNILIADDAPQFKLLTAFLGLCWVHAGRHFKKLNPIVPQFQEKLKKFQDEFWTYYGRLRKYQEKPDKADIKLLEKEFEKLFSTQTGYPELDERIMRTKSKENELLLVLKHPEVPLHNNRSENGARTQKRRQDVSLHTKSVAGTIAKDAMMSIVETCAKLGVNPRDFIKDRILRLGKIPRLGDMLKARYSSA